VFLEIKHEAFRMGMETFYPLGYPMPDIFHSHICPDGKTFQFAWDRDKDEINGEKHDVTFIQAVEAFCDPKRIIRHDKKHSTRVEMRFFLLGKVKDGSVLTVRYTRRDEYIRIIGAGSWHEGQAQYYNSNRA